MPWYWIALPFYLLGVNALAFFLFGLDKLFAIRGRHRIRERLLLTVTIIGGAGGALLGMVIFHHKVSKPQFRYTVPILFLIYFFGILSRTLWLQ